MNAYERLVRPVLFRFSPDTMHHAAVSLGSLLTFPPLAWPVRAWYHYEHPALRQELFGLNFPNPLGLAAGFDKDCRLFAAMHAIGFGFEEAGSITAEPFGGNPRPWATRLVADEALIVNYGLKNEGAARLRERFHRPFPLIVGASIAKTNKHFANEDKMIEDWTRGVRLLRGRADYLTINLSCPNTHDPCTFQEPRLLKKLLRAVDALGVTEPVFLKVGPDNNEQRIMQLLSTARHYDFIKGFIVSNLTKDRAGLSLQAPSALLAQRPGGLSGQVLKPRALTALRRFYRHGKDRFIFIGCGGIASAEDAYAYIRAGASLVQLITGLIFHGPGLVKEIKQGLVRLLERDGFDSIAAAVGTEKEEKKITKS